MIKLIYSGRTIDPMTLCPQDLDIRDIAHNLSLLCRYNGAFPFHYSVAQHSLLVVELMSKTALTRPMLLAGLLHDAAEYVLGDMNHHLKRTPMLAEYAAREEHYCKMIVAHYGVDPIWLDIVRKFDMQAAQIEMDVRDGKSFEIVPQNHVTIYHRFLRKFEELSETVPDNLYFSPIIPLLDPL